MGVSIFTGTEGLRFSCAQAPVGSITLMHSLDEEMQHAIEFDTYLEERNANDGKGSAKQRTQRVCEKDGQNVPRKSTCTRAANIHSSRTRPFSTENNHVLGDGEFWQDPASEVARRIRGRAGNAVFRDSKEESRLDPERHCGHCGCKEKYHHPPSGYDWSKTGSSSGKGKWIEIRARTCCWSCPGCICFCVAFLEPDPENPKECPYDSSRIDLPSLSAKSGTAPCVDGNSTSTIQNRKR